MFTDSNIWLKDYTDANMLWLHSNDASIMPYLEKQRQEEKARKNKEKTKISNSNEVSEILIQTEMMLLTLMKHFIFVVIEFPLLVSRVKVKVNSEYFNLLT